MFFETRKINFVNLYLVFKDYFSELKNEIDDNLECFENHPGITFESPYQCVLNAVMRLLDKYIDENAFQQGTEDVISCSERVFAEIAEEILNGKYRTLDEVRAAFRARLFINVSFEPEKEYFMEM